MAQLDSSPLSTLGLPSEYLLIAPPISPDLTSALNRCITQTTFYQRAANGSLPQLSWLLPPLQVMTSDWHLSAL